MTKPELLYMLTGTETPKHLTERENVLIDKCLAIINEKQAEGAQQKLDTEAKIQHRITELSERLRGLDPDTDEAVNIKGEIDALMALPVEELKCSQTKSVIFTLNLGS